MRSDMFKVIVERPRRGGGYDKMRGGWRRVGDDALPAKGPMRPRGSRTKWLNENLAPLQRFLDKRVGRYWPKVFSELCEHVSVDNAVQKHVRDHVDDFVATKTIKREDGVWAAGRRGSFCPLRDRPWLKFYVHPVSQVLMRNTYWHKRRQPWQDALAADAAALARRFRPVGPWCARHKIEGVWYELKLSPLPQGTAAAVLLHWKFDLRGGADLATVSREELAQRAEGYTIAKRQLSSRELAEAGLANDPCE